MNWLELSVMIGLSTVATVLILVAGSKGKGDRQSRMESLIESVVNVMSGFIISLTVWTFFIMPVWNLHTTFGDNLAITCVFTVISVGRGFLWRRFFNNGFHRRVHQWLSKT